MGLAERLSRASDRFFDRTRSPKADDVAVVEPTGSLADLEGRKYCVVVTYKKNGEPVPSPVWFGTSNGKLYFQTAADAFKVKRIGRNPEVRVAAADSRGKPLGAPFVGTARVVPPEENQAAERTVQSNYGLARRLYMTFLGSRVEDAYVEVTERTI
jgi:hypothetical protein